jgi:hypothetical protein
MTWLVEVECESIQLAGLVEPVRTCSLLAGLCTRGLEGFVGLLLEYDSIKLAGLAADRSPTNERLE